MSVHRGGVTARTAVRPGTGPRHRCLLETANGRLTFDSLDEDAVLLYAERAERHGDALGASVVAPDGSWRALWGDAPDPDGEPLWERLGTSHAAFFCTGCQRWFAPPSAQRSVFREMCAQCVLDEEAAAGRHRPNPIGVMPYEAPVMLKSGRVVARKDVKRPRKKAAAEEENL